MGKSEDRVWYFYKNVETGEHTMTTWDRMTDYFGWIEVTQKDYNQWVVSSELAPADADAPAAGRAGAGDLFVVQNDDATLEIWRERYWEMRAEASRLQLWVEGLQVELAALRQQLAAAEADNARLRSALEPFGVQWAEWKKFAENGGEVGIVEFFTDCMENEVLARDLRDAANALAADGAKGE